MKLALNGATTMKADLATDVRAAHLAGFQLLEIWAAKLRTFLKTSQVSDLNELFGQCAVKPLSINSIEHITFRNAGDYAGIKAECEELSSIASALGCPYIVVVPGRLPEKSLSRAEIVDESVRVLRDLAGTAESHRVARAFEFLGQTDCSVQKLHLANEIVGRVARRNGGLVIERFHFFAGGSAIEMIDGL